MVDIDIIQGMKTAFSLVERVHVLQVFILLIFIPSLYESKKPSWLEGVNAAFGSGGGSSISGGYSLTNPPVVDESIYERTKDLEQLDDIIAELKEDISKSQARSEEVRGRNRIRLNNRQLTRAERNEIAREEAELAREASAREQLKRRLPLRRAERVARE